MPFSSTSGRDVLGGEAAREEHADVGPDAPQLDERLVAVHVRHRHVEDDGVDRRPCRRGEDVDRLAPVATAVITSKPRRCEHQARDRAHHVLVVDEEDRPRPFHRTSGFAVARGGSSGAARAAGGNRIRNACPRPGSLVTRIAPWWPRTMPSTAASPSPRPVNFVVKNGSKIFCRRLLVHAAAGVGHLEEDVAPRGQRVLEARRSRRSVAGRRRSRRSSA